MSHNKGSSVITLTFFFAFIFFLSTVETRTWSVDPCAACRSLGKWAVGGCSGLVADLLGRPKKWTGHYEQGYIASNPLPGAIVGWKPKRGQKYGHVTIYVGNKCCPCKYVEAQLNVQKNGGTSVCRQNGYGRTIYHMGY